MPGPVPPHTPACKMVVITIKTRYKPSAANQINGSNEGPCIERHDMTQLRCQATVSSVWVLLAEAASTDDHSILLLQNSMQLLLVT